MYMYNLYDCKVHVFSYFLVEILVQDNVLSVPVGSDCLAIGSSRTTNPRVSGLPSGRVTCRKVIKKIKLVKKYNWPSDMKIGENIFLMCQWGHVTTGRQLF